MKRLIAVLCASILALVLGGCSEAPSDNHDADIKALKDNEVQWNKDMAAKDADKIVAHYAQDAVLMNPGMPASNGKAAILKTMKDMVTDPAFSLQFQSTQVDVAKSGDMAYTHGTYTFAMTDPATKKVINDKGTYVTVYKKQADGSWKAVQDAAISEMPPPAPEPMESAKGKKK